MGALLLLGSHGGGTGRELCYLSCSQRVQLSLVRRTGKAMAEAYYPVCPLLTREPMAPREGWTADSLGGQPPAKGGLVGNHTCTDRWASKVTCGRGEVLAYEYNPKGKDRAWTSLTFLGTWKSGLAREKMASRRESIAGPSGHWPVSLSCSEN